MKNKQRIIGIFCIFLLGINPGWSQQTIFNVPSAEVTPKGRVFTLAEFQTRPWNHGKFMVNTDYCAVGIGHNTELDLTVFNVSSPASNNITLGNGFKSAIPIMKNKFPAREYKFIVGSEVLTSVQGGGVGNWSYAELSGRVPKVNTRLTGGISAGTKQIFGVNTASFVGGIEQPVTQKFNLQTDWFSGQEHFAGFLITGFSYVLPKDMTLYAGYQIPNSSKSGNSGFVIQLAKIF